MFFINCIKKESVAVVSLMVACVYSSMQSQEIRAICFENNGLVPCFEKMLTTSTADSELYKARLNSYNLKNALQWRENRIRLKEEAMRMRLQKKYLFTKYDAQKIRSRALPQLEVQKSALAQQCAFACALHNILSNDESIKRVRETASEKQNATQTIPGTIEKIYRYQVVLDGVHSPRWISKRDKQFAIDLLAMVQADIEKDMVSIMPVLQKQ